MQLGVNDYLFADAVTEFDDAQVVLLGVPFDGTSSHRTGSSKAPKAIRNESYNYESYLNRYRCNLEDIAIHDMGNTKNFATITELVKQLPENVKTIIMNKKFLISLGGEHSITYPLILTHLEQWKELEFGIIYLDAHLDFRDSYLDEKFSHACVARRLSELVGINKMVGIGIRSCSVEEIQVADELNLRFYEADKVNEIGMQKIIEEAISYLDTQRIYLSIDMDVFDPSFAPGVGNPEYFGLSPWQIRECIESVSPFLFGTDIVEVSPPFDNGNTAALAAQLVQIIIANISR